MTIKAPVLHLICGKIASGKSTLAAKLSKATDTVLISEDRWLAALYSDQMSTPRDYVRVSAKLRGVIGPHVSELLRAGISVVLDFPANTVETRRWMQEIITGADADHQLHVLAPPDKVCLARLRARNAAGVHEFKVTDEQFWQVSEYFVAPAEEEGFNTVIYDQSVT